MAELSDNETRGNWTRTKVAGHAFQHEPARLSASTGYTVIYLHCSHAAKLAAFPAFTREFDRHGSAGDRAHHRTQLVDRPTWPDFDPTVSAEGLCSTAYCRTSRSGGTRGRRSLHYLGVSMGGQGALRMAYKHPNMFPVVAAIAPAIDFQKRIVEGIDPGLDQMYRDAEEARQDTATLHIHPLNWPRHQFFCCDPTDYRWHDSVDRLRMKLWSLGVPFEYDLETSPAVTASITPRTWRSERSAFSRSGSSGSGCTWFDAAVCEASIVGREAEARQSRRRSRSSRRRDSDVHTTRPTS